MSTVIQDFDQAWHEVNWHEAEPQWRTVRFGYWWYEANPEGEWRDDDIGEAYVHVGAFAGDRVPGKVLKLAVIEAMQSWDTSDCPGRVFYSDWIGGVDLPYTLDSTGHMEVND